MFIALLRFTDHRDRAAELMSAHQDWIKKGFGDGVFLAVGGLDRGEGGGILAHNCSRVDMELRLSKDPFVTEKVVSVELMEMSPALTDPRLSFLTNFGDPS